MSFCENCFRYPRKKSAMGSRVGGLNTTGLSADKALAGVPRLLDDLQRLSEDTDSADIVFILGREEERVFAHRVILMARYKDPNILFKSTKNEYPIKTLVLYYFSFP